MKVQMATLILFLTFLISISFVSAQEHPHAYHHNCIGCVLAKDTYNWCTQTLTCEETPLVPFLCAPGLPACLAYTASDSGVFEVTHNTSMMAELPVVDWLPSTNGSF